DTSFVRTAMSRAVELGKAEGERATIPSALGFLVFSQFWSGRFPSAAGTALSGLRASRESGQSIWATHHLASLAMIAAIQGDIETCQLRARAVATQAGENSLGLSAALAGWALAVLELSRGNAAEAFYRLRSLVRAGPGYGHPTMRLLTAPHFVEAATRMGETEWAAASWPDTAAGPSPWPPPKHWPWRPAARACWPRGTRPPSTSRTHCPCTASAVTTTSSTPVRNCSSVLSCAGPDCPGALENTCTTLWSRSSVSGPGCGC